MDTGMKPAQHDRRHLSIEETRIATSHHQANFKTDNLVLRIRLPHHSHRPRRTDRRWLV